MRSNPPGPKNSGAMLVFFAVYIAAFGLLLAPHGTFTASPVITTTALR